MKRLLLLLCMLWPCLGWGLEDAELARAAGEYQSRLDNTLGERSLDSALLMRRAERYTRQRLWREAIESYEQVVVAEPGNTQAWLQLGEAWQQATRLDGAQQRALEAFFNGYQNADNGFWQGQALFQLGDAYLAADRPQQAMAAFKEGLGLRESPEYAQRYQQLLETYAFQVEDLDVTSNSASPSICLRFSGPLREDRGIDYRDYLQIDPPVDAVVSARDERLCVEGVSHGQRYRLTLRAGLPGAEGGRLANHEDFTASVDHREASVGFRGNTYILPRTGGQGLPLTTVNVDAVDLTLLRINDRNLIEQMNNQRISSTLDGYDIEGIAERHGELIWQGEMAVTSTLNEEVTTAVPMDQALVSTAPGIYIVTATDAANEPNRWRSQATQWLVVSDLGLSTFQGDDGLHVFVRSLDSAQPLAGVNLRLYARNNGELGEARSDAQGYAHFPPGLLRGDGGNAPAALMAYGSSDAGMDFNFLDLSRPTFDLSDRGVAGRPAPGPVDAFLYTERGVYRPGEAVELTALLRDASGHAQRGVPLTLKLIRPDEVEVSETLLNQDQQGGFHSRIQLASNARTGRWMVRAYSDPEAEPIGEVGFQVEDFIPQQIRVELRSEADSLRPGETLAVAVQSDFLYGAPGADLGTQAELLLREHPDPYPDFPGFQFGLAQDSYNAERFPLEGGSTDAEGYTTVPVSLAEQPDTTRPLQALLRVSVFEPGGRPVNRTLGFAYRTAPMAIGIKPLFDESVGIGDEIGFEVVVLDENGEPQPQAGLRYELFREDYQYYWFYRNNRWDYKLIINDSEALASRSLDVAAGATPLSQPGVDWGNYRAEIYDPITGVASSVRFRVGWFVNPGSDDAPDKLQLTLDKTEYQAGETAQVYIRAPFAGEVMLNVLSDRLWLSRSVSVDEGGTTVELPVDTDWGPGVYLSATAFRPAEQGGRGPGRAIGVAWMGLDPTPRRLDIALDLPEEVRPRQRIQVPVSVQGGIPGEETFVTVAAVDEGILQLTDFQSPEPVDYFLGKRRLGMELLDLYGRLIESDGRLGNIRSGGDAFGRDSDGSGVRTVQTVALYSGIVPVDTDGQALIPLELPDFNGELRLMAVAWDASRVGQAEARLLVRDPLVARVYLPRFLAPDDQGQLTLTVQNLQAPPGDYQVQLSASGAVALAEGSQGFQLAIQDDDTPAAERRYTLQGLTPGVGQMQLQLDGPEGFSLTREWQIGVRAAQPLLRERQARRLAPGETLNLDAQWLADFLPGSGELRVSFSSRPNLDVAGLLDRLDRYPYGCLEQTTSRALPLVYLESVLDAYGMSPEEGTRQRVQQSIARVLAMQNYQGGFGLWNSNSPAELWLSAYALDFLSRAREADYLVPTGAYRRGLDWLVQQLRRNDYDTENLPQLAYAHYVLARAGEASIGDLRYLHDNYLEELPSTLARAQLAAALARHGDLARARGAFDAALEPINRPQLRDYGTALRDRAALITLLQEAGLLPDEVPRLAEQLANELQQRRYTSTQEQSWLLLAAHALAGGDQRLQLSVAGQLVSVDEQYQLNPSVEQLQQGLTVQNQGAEAVWTVLDRSGIPVDLLPPDGQGFAINRAFYNRDGQPVDLAKVAQNALLVVVITGEALSSSEHQALVVDLLPAGFEIENTRLGDGDQMAELDWLPELSRTENTEFRDDRFAAAVDLSPGQRNFALAYLVRAVTPGDYRIPAVFVEDMYQPWYHGRGALGRLQVQ